MNERIKELAEQVGFVFPSFGDAYCSGSVRYSIEEFAELIVKECADLCERIAKVHLEEENPIAYVYGSRQCRDTIKQYFGVEE